MTSSEYKLHEFKRRVQSEAMDWHLDADSIGTPQVEAYGVGLAWLIHQLTGSLPTRVGSGAGDFGNDRAFGMGLTDYMTPGMNSIKATQADPYLTTDGRAPHVLNRGSEFPHDGSRSYDTFNGKTGTIGAINADSNATASSVKALQGVLLPGLSNTVLAHMFVHAGSNGLPNRTIEVHDGNRNQAVVASFNPSTDIAGYLHLSEDHASARGSAISGMIGRIVTPIEISDQISGNENLRAIFADAERTTTGSNTAIDDGTNLTFAGLELSRLSGPGGSWVGGHALYVHNGSSWNAIDLATSSTPDATNPKRYTDEQDKHAISAWTHDPARRNVYVWGIASENLTQTQVRDYAIAYMDRKTAGDAANGRPTPIFLLVQFHRQGSLSEAQQRAWYAGLEEAARGRPNAHAIDGAAIYDYIVMDGSVDAQNIIAARGEETLNYGEISGGDISDGSLMSDGTHQNANGAMRFMQSIGEKILEAQPTYRRPGKSVSKRRLIPGVAA